ncbi:MAG: hypothetical protein B0W54_19005 [Cellvibrio sp. 79]|nr:MAG: hypothetical protein B0W54_19005 [Cellvibrio sp. 79]
MKKLTRIQQFMAALFLLVVLASFIGNALGYWLFYRNSFAGQLAESNARETVLLEKLATIEKLQRDTQYHNKTIEHANKENLKLQQALEFHQQLMNKTNSASNTTAQ